MKDSSRSSQRKENSRRTGREECDYFAAVHLEGSLLGIFGRAQHGNILGLLHVSDKAVALLQEVIVSRRDFDDPGFNLDNAKGKAVSLTP